VVAIEGSRDGQFTSAQLDTLLDKTSSGDEFGAVTRPQMALAVGTGTNDLTSAQVDMLLDKLSTDDDFRTLLLSDPAAALRQIGAPVELASCFGKCRQLADPQTLKASRAAIQKQLGGTLDAHIHDLRAG